MWASTRLAFFRRLSRAQFFAAVSLVAVLFVATFVRFRNVGDSLPYIRHVDEQTEANVALGMLRDGTTNPRRFNNRRSRRTSSPRASG